MMNKTQNLKQETHILKFLGIGLLISLIVLLILTGGMTTLIVKGTVSEKQAQIMQISIHTVSVTIGSMIALRKRYNNKVIIQVIMTVSYVLFCGLINIVLFHMEFNSIMQNMIAIAAGTMIVFILRTMMDKYRNNTYRKRKW